MNAVADRSVAKPLLVFGAGGLAADVADIIARVGGLTIAGFVVDRDVPTDEGAPLHTYHWNEIKHRSGDFTAVNGIGRPSRRAFIEKAEAAGFDFLTLVDPSAQVFPSASLAPGVVVGAGAIVAAAARIGRHVFLNRGVLIGHHTVLEPFVSIQAGARIGGHGRLAEQAEVGIGATIIDRVDVGARTLVGAGAVVVRDCPSDATMVGVPARALVK